ncbi:MAG: amino acid-binding protein [Desulfobacteraceae bacterium]|jgi:hypothetical protein|nr:amino acid-binding protein [Desulfobacteraceae bacterium]
MKLKQISIPIENSINRLYELTRSLADAGINLRALSLVDTGNFGELRILVSDVAAARQIGMQAQVPGRVEEVVAAEIDDRPGEFSRLLNPLLAQGIRIRYAYACAGIGSGKAVMVFSFNDNDRAVGILQQAGIRLLDDADLSELDRSSEAVAC